MNGKAEMSQPASFEAKDYTGKTINSSDYLGQKHVVLVFNRTLM